MTKSEITYHLNRLKVYGFNVTTFNSRGKMPTGARGFVDHVLIGSRSIWFLEVKLGADSLSEKQIELGKALKHLESISKVVRYRLLDDYTDLPDLIAEIIKAG